jgi:hypothetical protein
MKISNPHIPPLEKGGEGGFEILFPDYISWGKVPCVLSGKKVYLLDTLWYEKISNRYT